MYLNYHCCFFCPFWPYCYYYYYYSLAVLRMVDPVTVELPSDIAKELQPDLFDLIPENIFEELNPEGLPGVPGIPGESAFPVLTPTPSPFKR